VLTDLLLDAALDSQVREYVYAACFFGLRIPDGKQLDHQGIVRRPAGHHQRRA
jgi:hypothetical protein